MSTQTQHRQPSNHRIRPRRRGWGRPRHGVSLVEVLVSSVMLLTVMSIVGTVRFRLNNVWRDIRHQQIGIGELSNQLDRLTAVPIEQLRSQLDSLEPSRQCTQVLPEAKLVGRLAGDQKLGQRLTLELDWNRGVRGKPVQLSGWVLDSNSNTKPTEEALR